jgi:hypothetical protein
MLRLSSSFNHFTYQYTVLILLLLPIILPNLKYIDRPWTPLCPYTLNTSSSLLLLLGHPLHHIGIITPLVNALQMHHCVEYPPINIHPPILSTMPVITRSSNNHSDEVNALLEPGDRTKSVPDKTTATPMLNNLEEFPPLGLTLLPAAKKTKATSSSDMESKKVRPNGTTPKKDANNGTPTAATVDLTISTPIKSTTKADDSPAENKEDQGTKPPPRKLDQTFVIAENTGKTTTTNKEHQGQEKKALSFSAGMNFPTKKVDSSVKRISKVKPVNTPMSVPTNGPPVPTSTTLISGNTATTGKTSSTSAKPTKTPLPPPFNDPAPQGITPTPVQHNYSFVARVNFTVPNCSSFQHKVMNLLAFAMNTLRQTDPEATYLCLKDTDLQAATIQELPKLTTFFNDWSYFEHTIEEFKHYPLEAGKVRKYRASVFIGCNMEPKKLLSDTLLDLDKDLDVNIGGGKVTLEYKDMQVVDTDRHWILFGVPSETNPESFSKILKPFLAEELAKMKEKNPTKYSGSMFTSLPDFTVSISYVQNVPFKMTEGLPAYAKQCIHIEIRQSDKELFKELFKYITLSKSDKKYFGQFTRFHYGCPPGSSLTERETLGGMLQNHIAVIRSMGKAALPGILYPDKVISCVRDSPEPPVEISLRRIMMKQKIGRIKVWQCILPNSGGGWDGYYADGYGCSEHKVQAQHWALCVAAHLRFHLLRRGVQVESVKEFIDTVFTNDAAQEANGAKLINGKVFTQSAASAVSMRIDIEKCGWVNVNLGISGADTNPMVLSRPVIALRKNEDLSAHNFTTNRNPSTPDSSSVAYSTSSTTLGEEMMDHDDVLNDNAIITETNDDDNSFATEGSTDSQIWAYDALSEANTPIIDNMQDIMTEETQPVVANQDQLADLLRQIAILKESNDRLLAASAVINKSSTHGSRPTSDTPTKQGTHNEGDGGDN